MTLPVQSDGHEHRHIAGLSACSKSWLEGRDGAVGESFRWLEISRSKPKSAG